MIKMGQREAYLSFSDEELDMTLFESCFKLRYILYFFPLDLVDRVAAVVASAALGSKGILSSKQQALFTRKSTEKNTYLFETREDFRVGA